MVPPRERWNRANILIGRRLRHRIKVGDSCGMWDFPVDIWTIRLENPSVRFTGPTREIVHPADLECPVTVPVRNPGDSLR